MINDSVWDFYDVKGDTQQQIRDGQSTGNVLISGTFAQKLCVQYSIGRI